MTEGDGMDLLAHWKQYEASRDDYIVSSLRGGPATSRLNRKHAEVREEFAQTLATAQGAVSSGETLRGALLAIASGHPDPRALARRTLEREHITVSGGQ